MDWRWETFVFSMISFGILYYLLNKYAFGPLFSVMEKRREAVLNEIKTAEQNRAQSAQLLAEQKQAIDDAKREAHNIIEQSRATSSKQADDLIERAREETVRLKGEALKDIESEKNKAVAALRSQVSAMSVMIASKIIEKQIDEQSQAQIVEHYLKEVGGNR